MTDTSKTIRFKDRDIAIATPSGIQVAAWQRVATRFGEFGERSSAELTDEEASEFTDLINRLFRIVTSLFANQADKDWFEDQALDGGVTDEDLLDLLGKAFEGLRVNAEESAPTKKAARRQ